MANDTGYAKLIRPILYILDLLIISILSYLFLTQNIIYIVFFVALWFVLSISFSFYEVYRFTKLIKIASLLFKQILLFNLAIISFLYLVKSEISSAVILKFFLSIFLVLNLWRICLFFLFRKYRANQSCFRSSWNNWVRRGTGNWKRRNRDWAKSRR